MKKKLLTAFAVVAIAIQFFPAPAKTNPPTDPTRTFAAVMKPPAPLLRILQRACYDCHSHETQWPWYASIAPVSWPVRQHVVDGRKHVNFSEWIRPGEKQFSAWSDLEEICTSVSTNEMPLKGYDWMHPAAKLSDSDRKAVCAWIDSQISGAR